MLKRIIHFWFSGNIYQKVLFIFFIFLTLPLRLIEKPDIGLGPSWRISINLALKSKLVWGEDYAFTFGPLGYLYTRIAAFVPQWHITAFTLFAWLNILFIVRYFILSSGLQKKGQLLAGIIIALMFSSVIRFEITTTVMCIIIFHLLYSVKHHNNLSLYVATVFSVLNLFIKLNYFIPIIIIFFLYYLLIFIRPESKGMRRHAIYALLLQGLSIYVLVIIYNVNILGYIKSGWHLANSYNDAMFTPVYEESIISPFLYYIYPTINKSVISSVVVLLSVILTLPAIIVIVKNTRQIIREPFSMFIFLTTAFFLYISFKFAFVRHGGLTYLYPPLPLFIYGLMVLFTNWKRANIYRDVYGMIVFAFIPSCLIANMQMIRSEDFNYGFMVNKLKQLYRNDTTSASIKAEKTKMAIAEKTLPPSIREKIGQSTVDIAPSEISIAYFNKLNYQPRPIVQGYAAYDKYLDDLNYKKYISSSAPNYIIYKNETIDNRYHFFDEPRTKLAMMQYYEVIDTFNNYTLLKRAAAPTKIVLAEEKIQEIELNKFYDIPVSEHLQFATFNIQYTGVGKAQRFIFQPPVLNISFILDDGRKAEHRLIISSVNNPVLLSYYIETDEDTRQFLLNRTLNRNRITKLMISGPSYAYKREITMNFFNMLLSK